MLIFDLEILLVGLIDEVDKGKSDRELVAMVAKTVVKNVLNGALSVESVIGSRLALYRLDCVHIDSATSLGFPNKGLCDS